MHSMSRVPALNRSLVPLQFRSVASLAVLIFLVANCFAASPVMGDHETYLKAAKQPKMQDRLRELELFASSTETTALKTQALELMAWYYKQLGDEANANLWAKQLLTFDQENPLALAVLVENARRATPAAVSPETLSFAQRGLRRAERFEKPEGLPEAEFAQLRQRMLGTLHGTIGYALFQQRDYRNARTHLRTAVSFMADDAQFVYALGLADLEEPAPNPSEGYWYLARAVNLTQGTPAGRQIADYAASRYREEGGSDSAWNQFLASAAYAPVTPETAVATIARSVEAQPSQAATASSPMPAKPATPMPATPTGAGSSASASTQASAPPRPPAAAQSPPEATSGSASARAATPRSIPTTPTPERGTPAQTASVTAPPPTSSTSRGPTATMASGEALPQSEDDKRKKAADAECRVRGTCPESAQTEVAMLTEPPPPVIQRPPLSPRDPVSIGILIQAAIASDQNRSAVIYALVDMVRHLRNADEAFILSFGQQLEFQQDLTQNYDLLEAAMQAIRPDEGSALLDAVGFSSGHLARIAKNRNRVLLVISDGRDIGSHSPGYEITGQIDASGVRIYCIGVGVDDSGGRSRLEQLASRTGGRTAFISTPLQFRAAARQIAAGLGIEFPM
jgi:hypothetical protein